MRRGIKQHIARATSLVAQFANVGTVPMNDWMVLLLNIITKQPTKVIESSFQQAMEGNPHIGYYIADIKPPKLRQRITDPTADEARGLEHFIRVGLSAWETYPEAVRKVKGLVGAGVKTWV